MILLGDIGIVKQPFRAERSEPTGERRRSVLNEERRLSLDLRLLPHYNLRLL